MTQDLREATPQYLDDPTAPQQTAPQPSPTPPSTIWNSAENEAAALGQTIRDHLDRVREHSLAREGEEGKTVTKYYDKEGATEEKGDGSRISATSVIDDPTAESPSPTSPMSVSVVTTTPRQVQFATPVAVEHTAAPRAAVEAHRT